MPLTDFQRSILALLAQTRTPDRYVAGGAALHFAPNSIRYSNDLDFQPALNMGGPNGLHHA